MGQSDTPGNIGRFFEGDVLDAAVIKQLKSDLEVVEPIERWARDAMELDHDRKGVPGSPDLARTIMEKIEAAAVFVADMTPVGEVTVDTRKPAKKPVDQLERGDRARLLPPPRTDRALLMVMNTH